jgi:hypothetical protein
MARSRPISLSVLPDTAPEAVNTARVVLATYTTAMTRTQNERRAFHAAAQAWQERNPNASQDDAATAVANIISHTG